MTVTDTAAQSSTGQPPAKSMKGASFWISFGRWVCIIAAKHTLLWGDVWVCIVVVFVVM